MTISCPRVLTRTLLLALAFLGSFASQLWAASPCSNEFYQKLTEPATKNNREIWVQCNAKLKGNEVITKRLVFAGEHSSGVSFDCQGAWLDGGDGQVNEGVDMIEIRSRLQPLKPENRSETPDYFELREWIPPKNIRIQNCKIRGSMRIIGLGRNGEADPVRRSSMRENHSEFIQSRAPSSIELNKLTIEGTGRIPLYLAPGVHDVSINQSIIGGESVSVAVYFDAESTRNRLSHSVIRTQSKRESLALDGSSYNQIIGNSFRSLSNGGIFLYRNCGEGGTIRHNTPSHNQIINNTFYYKSYNPLFSWIFGKEPAIYIGSRDGGKYYCDDDKGKSFGSSSSDKDFARYNVIAQNKLFKFAPEEMFLEGSASSKPNYFFNNEELSDQSFETEQKTPSGCVLLPAQPDPSATATQQPLFIDSGEQYQQWRCQSGQLNPTLQ
ncbi:MAG: right-handed parallel beta-helix repeat-containing protein [Pseudomonadota bacterium]|nr:right-handed parallel beta-helix repeat-containing protein [Pseudomonadota bacterium]